MYMKKQIIVLLIIVFICGLILFSLMKLSGPGSPTISPNESSSFPIGGNRSSTIPSGNTISIPTKQGDVTINNVFKTGQPLPGGDNTVLAKRTPAYDILYTGDDNLILITINQTPVLQKREEAEQDFLHLFGITQEQACKLSVRVGTLVSVDPDLAGQELGLSFCPKP
jgi:hypothetical protein